jgi:two-component system sensor histidine kinase YesM
MSGSVISRLFNRTKDKIHRLAGGYISVRYKLLLLFLSFFLLSTTIITSVVFYFMSDMVKRNASNLNTNLVSHISDNIGFILDDVYDTSMSLLTNDDLITLLQSNQPESYEMIQLRRVIYRTIAERLMRSSCIDSVEVIGENGIGISMDKYYADSFKDHGQITYAKNLLDNTDWTPEGQLGYFFNSRERLSFLRVLRSNNNLSHLLGSLFIHMKIESLDKVYQNRLFYDNSAIYIVNGSGLIITSNRKNTIDSMLDPRIFQNIYTRPLEKYFEIYDEERPAVVFSKKIDNYDWYIINIVNIGEMLRENSVTWQFLILTIVFCSIGSILMVVLYIKRILGPLIDIAKAMKEIERENYAIRVSAYKNDEIGNIAKSFNHMAHKLTELIKMVYAFELKQREAQIIGLRSQMNPHFLYNMLDVIVWKSRAEHANATAEIARKLSFYLRKSITESKTLVTIRDELEHLTYYINLQKIRLADSVEFDIFVQPGCEEMMTIESVLQPLVENSINHGIISSSGVGRITVRIVTDETLLLIEVEDDGVVDIDPAELENLMNDNSSSQRGFAIKNINDRIHLLFGESYHLSYERTADGLTIARILQPIILGPI